jgi:hypothetical protein
MPAYLSLGFYDSDFGLYWLTLRGVTFVAELLAHVRLHWPFFNRSTGRDHLLVMTNDKGATFMRNAVPPLKHVVLVTQWGWNRPHIHIPGHDVVLPPMLKVDQLLSQSPFVPTSDASHAASAARVAAQAQRGEWRYLLSFIGAVRFHTPGYSMGVRQAIYSRYNATDGFMLRDLRGDTYEGAQAQLGAAAYLAVLQQSKFCLAPSGMGFSTRVYESIAQGCVPLIIQDDPISNTMVEPAFADLLPYERFSLRLRQADIPRLPSILRAFPLQRWRELRAALACVWPRLLWLQADNEPPGIQPAGAEVALANATSALGVEAGVLERHDAWNSLMATLSRRAMVRRGEVPSPFEWRAPARSCEAFSEGTRR